MNSEQPAKHPSCPHEPGSDACNQAVWPEENLCKACPWWDDQCKDHPEDWVDLPRLGLTEDDLSGWPRERPPKHPDCPHEPGSDECQDAALIACGSCPWWLAQCDAKWLKQPDEEEEDPDE